MFEGGRVGLARDREPLPEEPRREARDVRLRLELKDGNGQVAPDVHGARTGQMARPGVREAVDERASAEAAVDEEAVEDACRSAGSALT